MINNLKDIKELINKQKNEYKYGILDNLLDEYYTELKENKINWKHIETLENEEHRWYTVEINVYEFFKDNKSLGFLAVEEVGTKKSESMDYEDCYVNIVAYDVKEITKISFEIIN